SPRTNDHEPVHVPVWGHSPLTSALIRSSPAWTALKPCPRRAVMLGALCPTLLAYVQRGPGRIVGRIAGVRIREVPIGRSDDLRVGSPHGPVFDFDGILAGTRCGTSASPRENALHVIECLDVRAR